MIHMQTEVGTRWLTMTEK